MDYYDEIKNKLLENEVFSRAKDYSKERYRIITYFEIGRLLSQIDGKYGNNVIEQYSKKLMVEVGKKYNKRTLFRMRQFYIFFSNEKVSPMATHRLLTNYLFQNFRKFSFLKVGEVYQI